VWGEKLLAFSRSLLAFFANGQMRIANSFFPTPTQAELRGGLLRHAYIDTKENFSQIFNPVDSRAVALEAIL
jgi:hypothetical protein